MLWSLPRFLGIPAARERDREDPGTVLSGGLVPVDEATATTCSVQAPVHIYNGRPKWGPAFAAVSAAHPENDIGVAFCGNPIIAADLAQNCYTHSQKRTKGHSLLLFSMILVVIHSSCCAVRVLCRHLQAAQRELLNNSFPFPFLRLPFVLTRLLFILPCLTFHSQHMLFHHYSNVLLSVSPCSPFLFCSFVGSLPSTILNPRLFPPFPTVQCISVIVLQMYSVRYLVVYCRMCCFCFVARDSCVVPSLSFFLSRP